MALQHNTYFDDAVQSIGFERDGGRATVGVMDAGRYHFGTDASERVTVVDGELVVRLPDSDWQTFPAGASFEVPGSSGFDLEVSVPTAYLCEYL